MATVSVVRVNAGGDRLPVLGPVPLEKYAVTSSGTSTVVGTGSDTRDGDVWDITAKGGAVWVQIGPAPVASAGNDHLILDGMSKQFLAFGGHKVAVIDAA